MGSINFFKLVKESIIFLLLATGIAYTALYFINQGEMLLPVKPAAQIYVQDKADLLSTAEEDKLEKSCENLYHNTSIKLVFLTVDSMPGLYTLDEYARGIFNKWEIDSQAQVKGFLFIYDKKDNIATLETCYENNDNITNMDTKLALLDVRFTMAEGNAYKAFDTLVSEFAKSENGTSVIYKNTGESASNITNGTDDSFVPASTHRASTILFVFLNSIIIIMMLRKRIQRKTPFNTPAKQTNVAPVAYRRNYDEDYGDKDHIFSKHR